MKKMQCFPHTVHLIFLSFHSHTQGAHDKAVQYFKRALRLNRGYLAAWTLLGHEYMEAKNTPAAIGECLRVLLEKKNPYFYSFLARVCVF